MNAKTKRLMHEFAFRIHPGCESLRAACGDRCLPPVLEGDHIIRQIVEVGYKSLVLTIASGLALRDRDDLPSPGAL